MPTFVKNETKDDDILFVVWGELKAGQDPKKSYLVKEGETIEGVVQKIKDSTDYKKVYQIKVKGVEKPLLLIGCMELNNKMGYGNAVAEHIVKESELVRITYKGQTKTAQGRKPYQFDVEYAK
jgi:hypothetical protein